MPASSRHTRWAWAPSLGVEFTLRLDGFAFLFCLLITGIGALVVLYAGSYLAEEADKVIIVPGYGLAVAQAQGTMFNLMETLQSQGKEVLFGATVVADPDRPSGKRVSFDIGRKT